MNPMMRQAFELLGTMAADTLFHECQVPNCSLKSLGLICSKCSRRSCMKHIYVEVLGKTTPRPICACCIINAHAELLEVETVRADGVIDGEIVE